MSKFDPVDMYVLAFLILWFGLGARLFYNAFLKKDWWR